MGKFKFKLTNISIKDYQLLDFESKELIDFTIKENLKSNSILRLKKLIGIKEIIPKQSSLWNLTWSDIIELRESIKDQNLFEPLALMYGINENQFFKLSVFNAFSTYKWIVEQLKEISDLEKQELGHEITQEEKDAGVEALQDFGYIVAVDGLAIGNILKHKQILQLNYSIVFRKMCLEKVTNEIKKQYQENVSRKNQRNSY